MRDSKESKESQAVEGRVGTRIDHADHEFTAALVDV